MSGNLIIKDASELVTVSGFEAKKGPAMAEISLIPGGSVVIEQGLITRVGPTNEVLAGLDESAFTVIDAAGKAVLPGFVDAHTHFVFGGYRAEEFSFRLRGMSYMEIMQRGGGIAATVEATRRATEEELATLGRKRLDRMLSFGVTTVEGKSGYGLDLETELKQLRVMKELNGSHPVDVVSTFLGAHAVPAAYLGDPGAYIDYIDREVLPEVGRLHLAEFCDIFCEAGVFDLAQSRRLLERARSFGLRVKLHADELDEARGRRACRFPFGGLGRPPAPCVGGGHCTDGGAGRDRRASPCHRVQPEGAVRPGALHDRSRLRRGAGHGFQPGELFYRVGPPGLRPGDPLHGHDARGGGDGLHPQRRRGTGPREERRQPRCGETG